MVELIYQTKYSDNITVHQTGLGIELNIGDLTIQLSDFLFGKLQRELIPNLGDFVADSPEFDAWIKNNWCADCEWNSGS